MTTKEIAAATGKEIRAVQNWVKSVGAKNASSTSTHPADYTLEETCAIIEEGMGRAAADVYRTNAVHSKMREKKPLIFARLD